MAGAASPVWFSAAAIDALPWQRKSHLLDAEARRDAKPLAALAGLQQLGFQLVRLEPGREPWVYHRHLYEEQCLYVLEGEGEAQIGEGRVPLKAGDFLGFVAGGEAHTLRNTGAEPLLFIAARTQLTLDVCDYPRHGKRLYMNDDEEVLVDLSEVRRVG